MRTLRIVAAFSTTILLFNRVNQHPTIFGSNALRQPSGVKEESGFVSPCIRERGERGFKAERLKDGCNIADRNPGVAVFELGEGIDGNASAFRDDRLGEAALKPRRSDVFAEQANGFLNSE